MSLAKFALTVRSGHQNAVLSPAAADVWAGNIYAPVEFMGSRGFGLPGRKSRGI